MKSSTPHIEKIRKDLVALAKAKKEHIEHFKKGGSIADFKPKQVHASRPF